ncbi:right-handed parallel beta-helix repeat-containing protein [Hufsiella ginkgonis]|uniref:Right handed beta helix domain-containing protein n=1 Tax=Hufsiella ginkgonis TaxID=2695274 RepID=A0A7K1XY75_9SPHI|nr:right-handed parallel beta-helix repeat-containing protein [Hufsiella ginkgonis]MXV15778.1 hypothetical protein [Hufsiella ginkgonis]
MPRFKLFSFFLLAVNLAQIPMAGLCQSKPAPTTYYLDAASGNDQQDGRSPGTAWRSLPRAGGQVFLPGDSLLLRRGGKWNGQLTLQGSGAAGAPVVVAGFGTGARPLLNGNGATGPVVSLPETDHWEIRGLEITNPASGVGSRTGILVRAMTGTRKYFRFNDLFIHDITGDYSFETKGKNTGGIGIIGGPQTRFEDIGIENCEISNVVRVGIFTNLTDGKQATRGNRPIHGLVIRNNRIHHCAGDGAIIRYAYRPVISHNLAYENHCAAEDLVKHGVALWCRSTDEALFEYNEVHHTRGGMDGQAFDADLDSYRTVVQYNYTHDNEGGMMLVYGSSGEAVVRYNLSVNDGEKGKHLFDFPVWTAPRGSGIFHNNTLISTLAAPPVIADEALETARFYNNVFYSTAGAAPVIPSDGKQAFFSNNYYVGYRFGTLGDVKAVKGRTLKKAIIYGNGFDRVPVLNLKIRQKGELVSIKEKGYWLPDTGAVNLGDRKVGKRKIGIGAGER